MNYALNTRCTAHVTLKHGRVKEYGNRSVYVKDGQEFEIELYNPHTKSVLAKISINGIRISDGGIILRPAQRIFLERFLDTDKKFKFNTYEVENTQEAAAAIANNGAVKVEFFYEYEPLHFGSSSSINFGYHGSTLSTYRWNFYGSGTDPYYLGITTSGTVGCGTTNPTSTLNIGSSSLTSNSSLRSSNAFYCTANPVLEETFSDEIETGRIEQGSKSDQTFETANEQFNSYSSEVVHLKILPLSQKPVEISEIRNYCPSCGTRMKKSSWKFCPSCGTNLEN